MRPIVRQNMDLDQTTIESFVAEHEARSRRSGHHVQSRLNIDDKTRTSLFPWRGQFSPQLVDFLLSEYGEKNMTVLDPFCGSGTVLAESARRGYHSVGFDINPGAFLFASMHRFATVGEERRLKAIVAVECALTNDPLEAWSVSDSGRESYDPFGKLASLRGGSLLLGAASLMLSYGDGNKTEPCRVVRSICGVGEAIRAMPHSEAQMTVGVLDSRHTGVAEGTVDLAITSPPYINVFNYHQNYRVALERMGWAPLRVATAEIGANRKHRQNRYLTVIQYGMDMGQALMEMRRLLRPGGRIVLIVGRCSSVRRVAFPNGLMLALVAEGLGFAIEDWRERQFLNRFGETIFEDVLTLACSRGMDAEDPVETGRSVGVWALTRGLLSAKDESISDIRSALENAQNVRPSPRVQVEVPTQFLSLCQIGKEGQA